ncbi:MAG: 1-pyrroline-5-carboxylate dehydrogenase [Phycisphaerae bacterium]|nr:1-pyrroline-5-carboxylate dehydrogenase [Phycisphaerae bacterium]
MNTLQERIFEIGSDLLERARAAEPRFYHYDWWEQQGLNWTTRDEWLKVRLFRFIEVLPSLLDDADIAEHLQLYLKPTNGRRLPTILELATSYQRTDSLFARLMAGVIRRGAAHMATRFVAGSNAAEAIATIQRLRRQRMAFTLDLLGEAITSEAQADKVTETYIQLITELGQAARHWPRLNPIDFDAHGHYPIVNVSVKLTALYSQFSPIAWEKTKAVISTRLSAILRAARQHDAFVNVDTEQYRYKELTFDIFRSVLDQPEFRDFPDVGIVVQAYLRDAESDLQKFFDWNRRRNAPLAIRLVKGAYWDYESRYAGHAQIPVWTDKWQSDANFERCTQLLFEQADHIRPVFGTHNIRSIAHIVAQAEVHGVDLHDYEIQMLYGMGEPLKKAVRDMGYFLRIYTPYGEMVPGMAYLIRRLLENTANESFLRQSFAEHLPPEVLLAEPGHNGRAEHAPVPTATHSAAKTPHHLPEELTMNPFKNEIYTDFGNAEHREKMVGALRDWRVKLNQQYPLVINNQAVTTGQWISSVNPAQTSEVIGQVGKATVREADQAVAAAKTALASWRRTPHTQRAELLRRTAAIMRRRRFELNALLTLEAGKIWLEADADVAEAIDFCEYYAQEAERMFGHPQQRNYPGETNLYTYHPRGVVLVVAPWNFPLAILTGMTVAAIVTGNTVIMKPASTTAVIGATLQDILQQAGLPPGVCNFLPGPGSSVGEHLVRHKDVHMIIFTGSRDVGLNMIKSAAEFSRDQRFIKKVVCELGGKNAIIVDRDADLDAAVQGVIASSFGYTGQKCSACSRAIVLAEVYDKFIDKLVAAAKSIPIGSPDDPANFVGPVIDEGARQSILKYAETGRREGRVIYEAQIPELMKKGYFVPPMIIADVSRNAVIAQEEIFGPVLAVIKAKDFDDALDIANDTSYALTGGMFSRNPKHLERLKQELEVGNMYLNRKITGALVDRQPFGGFKMSGIGSKAGGPDYLIQFVEPRTITENTVRTGMDTQTAE